MCIAFDCGWHFPSTPELCRSASVSFFFCHQRKDYFAAGEGKKKHQPDQRDHNNQLNQCETIVPVEQSVVRCSAGGGSIIKACSQYDIS